AWNLHSRRPGTARAPRAGQAGAGRVHVPDSRRARVSAERDAQFGHGHEWFPRAESGAWRAHRVRAERHSFGFKGDALDRRRDWDCDQTNGGEQQARPVPPVLGHARGAAVDRRGDRHIAAGHDRGWWARRTWWRRWRRWWGGWPGRR